MPKVIFQPEGRDIEVPVGTNLMECSIKAGFHIDAVCGGKGTCGKCKVYAWGSLSDVTESEKKHISPEGFERGMRLACQAQVTGDVRVSIPDVTRVRVQQILLDGTPVKYPVNPEVKKYYVEIPEPTLKDSRSDWERVEYELVKKIFPSGSETDEIYNAESLMKSGINLNISLELLRKLPALLRESQFRLTAVIRDRDVIDLEPGDTTGEVYGVAFDIGTTTVVGYLIDLASGREVATASVMNGQVIYGDNVISRIDFTVNEKDGLEKMQEQIVRVINEIIDSLIEKSGVSRDRIYEMTEVGNSCMQHLLFGLDPKSLALTPYVGVTGKPFRIKASDIGIKLNDNAVLYGAPCIGGFVGADTVGVILSTRMMESEDIVLAIDLGTNGEMALGNRDRLISCSTAAGPAFEGAHIKYGMRGTYGAIERVKIKDDIEIKVIGGVKAEGICGSGLVDAVAELLKAGVIDPMGRILSREELADSVSPAILRRVIEIEGGQAFVLADGDQTRDGEPIYLTQRDIRELQLAKGAIFAGVQILKEIYGIGDDKISEVILAGAFGNYIDRASAVTLGLIPALPLERIRSVGNAAGVGAKVMLVSAPGRADGERIARRVEYIELANHPHFQDEFMNAMIFPEPDQRNAAAS